jgi:hypothetical protein
MARRRLSMRAYLAVAALSAGCVLALVWAWVALMPLAFLDPEYPAWAAKETMIARCDVGQIAVVGDSRAAADIMPRLMPYATSNLAVGGGEAIEALSAARRALACPQPPRLVVISINPGQFVHPDLFWGRTVRFGFLRSAEIAELANASRTTGDWSVYESGQGDGLTGRVRAALYAVRFPTLYFGSLVKGGGFLRLWDNRRALAEHLASRGQYFFGTAPGCGDVAIEGHLDAFRPLPVLDLYFDRLLALLKAHGVPAIFVAMPVNRETWQASRPTLRAGFAAYLRRYEAKYPNFRVITPTMIGWPDRFFGDDFSHLNPAGARRLSASLARCLGGGLGACALDWDAVVAQTAPRMNEEEGAWSRFPASRFPASITAASATSSSPR